MNYTIYVPSRCEKCCKTIITAIPLRGDKRTQDRDIKTALDLSENL